MNLWQRHRVEMAVWSRERFMLNFQGVALSTPYLDSLLHEEHVEQYRLEERDFVPRHVAVLRCREREVMCAPVTWAQYIALSKVAYWEDVPLEERFHILAVSVLVWARDDKVILRKRSGEVSHFADTWHVTAAGYVGLHEAVDSGSVEIAAWLELGEEVCIFPDDFSVTLTQIGICRYPTPATVLHDVCYIARVARDADEIVERAQGASHSWEGELVLFTQDAALHLLRTEAFNPAGAATLITALSLR